MLSKFIEQLRKQHELTQEYIASAIGVSRPTYIQFERGERDLTITEAKKLAELFNMQLDDLLNERQTVISINIEKDKRKAKKEQNEIRISMPQQKVDKFRQVLFYILKKWVVKQMSV